MQFNAPDDFIVRGVVVCCRLSSSGHKMSMDKKLDILTSIEYK